MRDPARFCETLARRVDVAYRAADKLADELPLCTVAQAHVSDARAKLEDVAALLRTAAADIEEHDYFPED